MRKIDVYMVLLRKCDGIYSTKFPPSSVGISIPRLIFYMLSLQPNPTRSKHPADETLVTWLARTKLPVLIFIEYVNFEISVNIFYVLSWLLV